MDPIVTTGIVAGLGSLLGGILGMSSQDSANKKNMELAQYAFDRNLDMWNLQNEYNLPINQMERIRAAGLNPNLVYGSGSVTGNTVGNAPQYDAPHVNPTTNGGFVSDAVNHAMLTPHNMANLDSQTSANEALAAERIANRVGKDIDNKMKGLDYHRASQLYQNSLDMADASLREMRARADVREKEAAMKNLDFELRSKYGDKLNDAQIKKITAEANRLIWDLDLEKGGRLPASGSILNWFINQVIRVKNGEPSAFDVRGIDVDTLWNFINPLQHILK